MILSVGLVLTDLQIIILTKNQDDLTYELYYLWAFFCLMTSVNLIDRMKRFRLARQALVIIFHAVNRVSPVIFVIIINYALFGFIGECLFAGKINSSLPEVYLNVTGGPINRDYQKLNWNDYFNSLSYIWAMEIFNQLPDFVNMCALARNSQERDYSGIFFAVFFIFSNMILLNILIGHIISICLDFFKKEEESKDYQQSVLHFRNSVSDKVHMSFLPSVITNTNNPNPKEFPIFFSRMKKNSDK